MKNETYTCDIKGCKNSNPRYKQIDLQVISTTEQEEGRRVDPYLAPVKIDICEEHMKTLLKTVKYIQAEGGMWYNNYYLREDWNSDISLSDIEYK